MQELWFLRSARCLMLFDIFMKFLDDILNRFQVTEPASVAQFDARPTGDQEVAGPIPRRGRQHSFVEIDHEIFPTVILSLPLIQKKQLSASGERMCTILVNRLEV